MKILDSLNFVVVKVKLFQPFEVGQSGKECDQVFVEGEYFKFREAVHIFHGRNPVSF